jgi:dihydroneopterin aldolase
MFKKESRITRMNDILQLEVRDLEVQVLTGIYYEETHLSQPVRISVVADLACPAHFAADTPLSASMNYMHIRRAITQLPEGVHFVLIESLADHIADTLFAKDARVLKVDVHIVKLAISEAGEGIGIRLVRHRK